MLPCPRSASCGVWLTVTEPDAVFDLGYSEHCPSSFFPGATQGLQAWPQGMQGRLRGWSSACTFVLYTCIHCIHILFTRCMFSILLP